MLLKMRILTVVGVTTSGIEGGDHIRKKPAAGCRAVLLSWVGIVSEGRAGRVVRE